MGPGEGNSPSRGGEQEPARTCRRLQEAHSCNFLQLPASSCSVLRCSTYVVPRLLLADEAGA
eukprot:15308271-Alexandrium_andersonii.AAC.1